MEKKEKKPLGNKIDNPRGRSYPKELQLECVNLLKSGLTMEEVSKKYNGHPGMRAIRRFCKKFSYDLGKKSQ